MTQEIPQLNTFQDAFEYFVRQKRDNFPALTQQQLVGLTGISDTKIDNWFKGRTKNKPRDWRDIVKLAKATQLSKSETDLFLKASKHLTIDTLLGKHGDHEEDFQLLSHWEKDKLVEIISNDSQNSQAKDQDGFLNSVPQSIQNALIGTGEDFTEGVAGELLSSMLEGLGRVVNKRFRTEEIKEATHQALAQAIFITFDDQTDDPETILKLISLFGAWIKVEAVVDELSLLIDPRQNEEFDVDLLVKQFEQMGANDDEFLHGLDIRQVVTNLPIYFLDAAIEHENLQGIIKTNLLSEIVDQLPSLSSSAERTAVATENTQQQIEILSDNLVNNGKVSQTLQTELLRVNKEGFAAQSDFFEVMLAAVEKNGLTFKLNANGRLEGINENRQFNPELIVSLTEEINKLLETLKDHNPTDKELDILEAKYRRHIESWFKKLDFKGLTRVGNLISLPLEEIFVDLTAVSDIPEDADSYSIEEKRLLVGLDDAKDNEKQEMVRQLDAIRYDRLYQNIPERKSIINVISKDKNQAVAILGDPGSGKSTLLRYLALIYSKSPQMNKSDIQTGDPVEHKLPIFIPLAAFDDIHKSNPDITLWDFLPIYYEQRRRLPGLFHLFKRAVENGTAIFLFDGLDEVLNSKTRRFVSEQVDALSREFSGSGVQTVVSSRFVGYREAPLSNSFTHFSVVHFGQSQIESFIHQWAFAFERERNGGVENGQTIRLARNLEKDLLEDIRSNQGVRNLAANPFLLTMLALMRRQVGRLPNRRIKLYERYIEVLVESWIDARSFGERRQSIQLLEVHEVEKVLIPLSLWLHQNKPSGTVSKNQLLNRIKVINLDRAGLDLQSASPIDIKNAEEYALQFFGEMRNMTGLIIERGYDDFGFSHLTFQEYFVGRALAKLESETRWQIISESMHNPRWREPILLCFARLSLIDDQQKVVSELINNIIDYPDETDNFLHRKLSLTLALASEDIDLPSSLLDHIGDRFARAIPTYTPYLDAQMVESVAKIISNGEQIFLTHLEKTITDNMGWWYILSLCQGVTNYLHISELVDIVLPFLTHRVKDVRTAAIVSLSTVSGTNENVKENFVSRMIQNPFDRQEIIKNTASKFKTNEKLKKVALRYLPFNHRLYDDRVIVDAFSPFIKSDIHVRNLMLKRFEFENDPSIKALTNYISQDAQLRKDLFARYHKTENQQLKISILSSLKKAVSIDLETKNFVLNKYSLENGKLKKAALSSLAGLIESDEKLRYDLILAFLENDLIFQNREIFQKVAAEDNVAKQIFVKHLKNSPDLSARWQSLTSLSLAANEDPDIAVQISHTLNDPIDYIQLEAIESLSRISENKKIIDNLKQLKDSEKWKIRKEIALHYKENPSILKSILTNRVTKDGIIARCFQIFKHANLKNTLFFEFGKNALNDERPNVRSSAFSFLIPFIRENDLLAEIILAHINKAESLMEMSFSDDEIKEIAIVFDTVKGQNLLASWLTSDYFLQFSAMKIIVNQPNGLSTSKYTILSKFESGELDATRIDWLITYLSLDLEIEFKFKKRLTALIEENLSEKLHFHIDVKNFELELQKIRKVILMNETLLHQLLKIVSDEDGIKGARRNENSLVVNAALILSAFIKDYKEIQTLFISLFNKQYQNSAYGIYYGLAWLSQIDKSVRNLLIRYVDKYLYEVYESKIILYGLSRNLLTDSKVSDCFLNLAKNENNGDHFREIALEFLSQKITSDIKIQKYFIDLSTDLEENLDILLVVTSGLSTLVNQDKQVRKILIDIAMKSQNNWEWRVRALGALLSWVDFSETDLLSEALALLRADVKTQHYKSDYENTLDLIANLVGGLLPKDEKLKDMLLVWLQDSSEAARLGAVRALSNWPNGLPDEIADSILTAVQDQRGCQSYPAQLEAASSLINDPNKNYYEPAIDLCLEATKFGTGFWDNEESSFQIRKEAILILSKIKPLQYDDKVFEALQEAMQFDENLEVKNAAYRGLLRLMNTKDSIVNN